MLVQTLIIFSKMYACVYLRPTQTDKVQFDPEIRCGLVMKDDGKYVRLFYDNSVHFIDKKHIQKYWYIDYKSI